MTHVLRVDDEQGWKVPVKLVKDIGKLFVMEEILSRISNFKTPDSTQDSEEYAKFYPCFFKPEKELKDLKCTFENTARKSQGTKCITMIF